MSARVATVRVEPYRRAFRSPVVTSRDTLTHRNGWYVTVTTDEGHQAVGEAAALPSWSRADHALVGEALDALGRRAVGSPLAEVNVQGPIPEAQAGLAAACMELAASERGETLGRFLGATSEDGPELNSLLVGTSADDLQASLTEAIGRGHRVHKLKVGLADDIDRMGAVLEGLPPDHRLRLDANAAWTSQSAPDHLGGLADLDPGGDRVEYIEDPVATVDDLVGLDSPFPVAVDELVRSTADLRKVLAERSAQVLVVKPMLIGGIGPARVWARQAWESDVAAVVTSAYETEVALAHWAALARSLPGPARAHGLAAALLPS